MSWACARALRSMIASARASARRLRPAGAEDAGPAEDGRERRAQLVAERGEELVLGAVRGLGRGARARLRLVEARAVEGLGALPRERQQEGPLLVVEVARLVEDEAQSAERAPAHGEREGGERVLGDSR